MSEKENVKVEYEELTVDDTPESGSEGIDKKQKTIVSAVLLGIILLVGGAFYYFYTYLPEQEAKAEKEMFRAVQFYEMDSLDLALNGSGQYPGFLRIIDKYSGTKKANLSKFYVGSIFLKKGDPNKALKYLEDFDYDENMISAAAYAARAGAYMELKNFEKAAKYYEKAAETEENSYTSPLLLIDAATAYELAGKNSEALEVYKKLKKKFPNSEEGQQVDKFIQRLEVAGK